MKKGFLTVALSLVLLFCSSSYVFAEENVTESITIDELKQQITEFSEKVGDEYDFSEFISRVEDIEERMSEFENSTITYKMLEEVKENSPTSSENIRTYEMGDCVIKITGILKEGTEVLINPIDAEEIEGMTVLFSYDIAFVADGEEYEPENISVSVEAIQNINEVFIMSSDVLEEDIITDNPGENDNFVIGEVDETQIEKEFIFVDVESTMKEAAKLGVYLFEGEYYLPNEVLNHGEVKSIEFPEFENEIAELFAEYKEVEEQLREELGILDDEEAEPTATPSETPSASPSADPSATPTINTSASPTVEPTVTPEATPSATPEAIPDENPTETPGANPTETPTVEPTQEPTPEPTQEPTPEPIQESTPEPTQEPASGTTTEIYNVEDV